MTKERAKQIFINELRKEHGNMYAKMLADSIEFGEEELYVTRSAVGAILEACREAAIDLCTREV